MRSSSVLKSWSRSTTEVVVLRAAASRRRRARSASLGPGRERDVAVGDARQRGEPDRRLRALVQRRVRLLDRTDRRLVVVGQHDVVDPRRRAAADLDVVVLHELARVLEHQLVLGARRSPSRTSASRRPRARASAARPAPRATVIGRHSIPSGPCDAPARNCRTNGLSESNSSAAGPDSTIRPRHSTAMYSATRLARHDVVRDDDVGAAVLLVDLLDQLAQQRRADRVQAGVGLVEQHDVGVEHERAREAGALAHPARELVRHLVARVARGRPRAAAG